MIQCGVKEGGGEGSASRAQLGTSDAGRVFG
jgi:hypothetical protein